MSTRPSDDPLTLLQRAIDTASSGHGAPAFALPTSQDDALANIRELVGRASREHAWPPPLSGILSSLYHALDLGAPLHEDGATPRLVDQLDVASVPSTTRAPRAPAPPSAPTPPPASAASAGRAAVGAPDRTAELLLAAIGSRPLDGPSRAIVARLLTEAIAEEDWASAKRALEIVVTGG